MKRFLKLFFIQLPFVPLMVATANTANDLPGIDVTVQSLFDLLQGLACWMSRFVLVFMVGAIIWYGFQFIISRGNPTAFGNAKKSIGHAIIGIVVVLGAYTIIATVGNAVQAAGGQESLGWYAYTPLTCSAN